jgi:hypothetical protein
MKPAEETQHLDLYFLRQQRIDFTTVGFQVISRIGHYIYFGEDFTPEQRNILVKALASLDYNRDAELWQNTLVMDDGEGGKKIIIQISAVKKAVKVVINAIRQITEINLL